MFFLSTSLNLGNTLVLEQKQLLYVILNNISIFLKIKSVYLSKNTSINTRVKLIISLRRENDKKTD